MKTVGVILVSMILVMSCCSAMFAYTLSFDDIPSGSDLQSYTDQYGATFSQGFIVADHTASSWGIPHSPSNVLVWNEDSSHIATLRFDKGALLGSGSVAPYSISSLSAYFSTDAGVQIRLLGFQNDVQLPVASVWIGDPIQSWDNQLAELRADYDESIDYVVFEGPFSADARLGFCADDMTIEPVPEPSCILVLGGALLSAAAWYFKLKLTAS